VTFVYVDQELEAIQTLVIAKTTLLNPRKERPIPAMLSKPAILLRLEGACVFLLSLFLYRSAGGTWGLLFLLFLWPDLSMYAYWINVQAGSALYNLVHTDAAALTLAAVAPHQHNPSALDFALIWLAHIGLDRALGYGLKYPTFFKDTHLQHLDAGDASVTGT
jgi:hypothetical protein